MVQKIQTDLKVVGSADLNKAIAAEVSAQSEDGDLEKLLAEQAEQSDSEEEDTEDDTENL